MDDFEGKEKIMKNRRVCIVVVYPKSIYFYYWQKPQNYHWVRTATAQWGEYKKTGEMT